MLLKFFFIKANYKCNIFNCFPKLCSFRKLLLTLSTIQEKSLNYTMGIKKMLLLLFLTQELHRTGGASKPRIKINCLSDSISNFK